ncbi:Ankyrin [Coniochaeta hoffmannii]|uniref:Ankyrin n=1 Tax=Coniochaeta hoffmannii TaxID=91930 RepID=A0AA38S0B9_9PEZI|nr:Ankyrin [Coniochaeta hoffmannii]
MALNSLPNELLLLIASYLDDIDDKSALARTCRRTYEATRCDIFRLLAVDEHANAAIRAAITGHTAILDALWPYNPRLVNRYWEYDPEPYEGNLRERDLRDWDQSGYPCPLALGSRSEKSAKLLIERGASLNTSAIPRNRSQERRHQLDCWTPPLCVAAAYGLSDTVRLVLRKGIPVDERDDWGYTALHHAADSCWEEEYLGVLKVLLDAGADLNDRANATHRNPLEIAFRQGNFAVVNHLLDLGATLDQLNDEDGRGATGLGLLQFTCAFEARGRALRSCVHSCFSNSRLDTETFTKEKWERARQALVLKLLDLGYDPNSKASLDHPWCRDDIDGYAPPRGQLDQAWWETRARSNILPRTNVTALNAVSFDSGADLMNLLIRRGAEVDAQDSNGLTVLWLQCLNEAILDDLYPYWEDTFTYPGPGYQWREKMKLLLRAGARIDPWVDTAAT